MGRRGTSRTLLFFVGLLGATQSLSSAASESALAEQSAAFVDAAAERLAAYIRIDTTNPPGRETTGVEFLGSLLREGGIEYEVVESAPGRGNLWARLPATARPAKPGLVLLHHIDVVPANPEFWTVDPFGGVIKDGYVWGRGAADTKGLGIAQLQAFLALAASGGERNRDVIYVATADEEAGGFLGAGWLVQHRRDLFSNVGYLLNEGGGGRRYDDETLFLVEVTQKVPVWLRVTATGRSGHGSVPRLESAVTRLLRAGHRLATTRFPPRIIEPVEAMFAGMARHQPPYLEDEYANIRRAARDPDFLAALQIASPGDHALLRDTCSLTTLAGSATINVVPSEAVLELDCRLLPDADVDKFIEYIETVINDPQIRVAKIMSFSPAVSAVASDLMTAIEAVTTHRFPGSHVVPGVSAGFTDSHFFRDIGITAYGFAPFATSPESPLAAHGDDERLSLDNLNIGTRTLMDLLERFVVER